MISENRPFFSVVIPLYNKQNYIKETIKSVLNQTFQNFEIVVVNDGSKDDSIKIIESIQDYRIKLVHQENSGVSVARNMGIKEANAKYIAFLDADDLWLPEFLQTIYELIQNFPDAGLYATAYKKRKENGEENEINIQGLSSKEYEGYLPNYFESIVKGDNLVWSSATCIPKKVFIENDIWFPVGEKYGEDLYVWARVAMKFAIAYSTKICSIYKIEAENNTINTILKEKEAHKSFLMMIDFRDSIKDEKLLFYFDKYIEKLLKGFVYRNILRGDKIYAFKQMFEYRLSFKYKIIFIMLGLLPVFSYKFLQNIRNSLKKNY